MMPVLHGSLNDKQRKTIRSLNGSGQLNKIIEHFASFLLSLSEANEREKTTTLSWLNEIYVRL